jgi:hypothetical protein
VVISHCSSVVSQVVTASDAGCGSRTVQLAGFDIAAGTAQEEFLHDGFKYNKIQDSV